MIVIGFSRETPYESDHDHGKSAGCGFERDGGG
jgi:hypothetical protein